MSGDKEPMKDNEAALTALAILAVTIITVVWLLTR